MSAAKLGGAGICGEVGEITPPRQPQNPGCPERGDKSTADSAGVDGNSVGYSAAKSVTGNAGKPAAKESKITPPNDSQILGRPERGDFAAKSAADAAKQPLVLALKIPPFKKSLSAVAADKSLSHRAALFSLLAEGESRIHGYLLTGDCLQTLALVRALGASVRFLASPAAAQKATGKSHIYIDAPAASATDEPTAPTATTDDATDDTPAPTAADDATVSLDFTDVTDFSALKDATLCIRAPEQIASPAAVLDCGNAGTLMRLALGILSAVPGSFVLSGDEHLNARPMRRVSAPLNAAGAQIYGREEANFAPLYVRGATLKFFELDNDKLSAQVKSAAILAGLLGSGCVVRERERTREHTEELFVQMGADIRCEAGVIEVSPLRGRRLKPLNLRVGNDPSSAFFFAVLCAIVPRSELVLEDILLSDTRIEAYKVLENMGVWLQIQPQSAGLGRIILRSPDALRAYELSERIAWLIDEIPALSVAMAFAAGTSRVRNAAELRVKECDRIAACVHNLRACGVECREFPDGFEVQGNEKLRRLAGRFGGGGDDGDGAVGDCTGDGGAAGTGGVGASYLLRTTPETAGVRRGLADGEFGDSADTAPVAEATRPTPDHFAVQIRSFADHRIAMAFSLFAVCGRVELDDAACVAVSFDNYYQILRSFCDEN